MIPLWLQALSFAFVLSAVICGAIVIADLARHPQEMWIMDVVWPLTVLYSGLFGLWAYFAIGRQSADEPDRAKPFWQAVLTGATHCGAGCALGDLIGEWAVFATGLTLFSSILLAKYVVEFVLAYALGVFFQYFSIAPMRGLGFADGVWAAIKADTLSLTAFEIGMFAWMAVTQKLLFPGLEPTSWTFWFMMQIAMMLGLVTTVPMNWWLIRRGIKEAM
jgi:hypothetical protein